MDASTAVLAQKAEGAVALENGFFPKPERAMLGLIAYDELPNMLQQVEWEFAALHVGEEVELDRLTEYPGGDSFLDQVARAPS